MWRGLGKYWTDERGFVFRRLLMQREIVIPFATMRAVKIGRWHAGTWGAGQPIVKIVWESDGRRLSSGILTTGRAEADRLRYALERGMQPASPLSP